MTAVAAAEAAPPKLGPFVVPLLALAVFVNYVDRGNLATAAPLIKDELKLTSTEIGILTSAFSWTYVPAQLLAGWMSERINPYRTLAIGLVIWSLATFMTGFATGFAGILMLRLMLGVGESAAFPCSSKLIAQHVEPHRTGAVNALIAQGLSLGPAFGVFFGGLLMAQLGWRNVFLAFGALSLLWLVPWIAATRKLSVAARQPQPGHEPSLLDILRRRELWGASLGNLSANYPLYFLIAWLPLYLVKARGYTLAEMAGLSGLVYLVFAASALASGWLSDRWIAAGAGANRVRKISATVSHLLVAAGLLTCAWGDGRVLMAGFFVTAAAAGMISPHVFAIGQTLGGPRGAGKWMGVQNCVANLSGIVGPIVTGLIIDATGGFEGAFAVTAGVALLGIVGWVWVIPKIAPLEWAPTR